MVEDVDANAIKHTMALEKEGILKKVKEKRVGLYFVRNTIYFYERRRCDVLCEAAYVDLCRCIVCLLFLLMACLLLSMCG